MKISADSKLMTNCTNGIHRQTKGEDWILERLQASHTLKQLSQIKAKTPRFSEGLHKPSQL